MYICIRTGVFAGVYREVEARIDGDLTLHIVVAVVRLGAQLVRIYPLSDDVPLGLVRAVVCDVDPLAVQVASVQVPTVSRNTLTATATAVPAGRGIIIKGASEELYMSAERI